MSHWLAEETEEAEVIDTYEEQLPATSQGGSVAISRGEMMARIDTAHRFPRNMKDFQAKATELACFNERIAQSTFYKLPRGGKNIEGPSIRLAEIIAVAWKNLYFGSRTKEESDGFIISEGYCYDLENNIGVVREVRRRITDKNGRRFNDDMITVTANAAGSIAMRNAILAVIPRAFADDIYHKAKDVALGKTKGLEQRRGEVFARLISLCQGKGVDIKEADILASVNRPSVNDINWDDIETLIGYGTSIADGELTASEIFQAKADGGKSGMKLPTKAKGNTKKEDPSNDGGLTASQQTQLKYAREMLPKTIDEETIRKTIIEMSDSEGLVDVDSLSDWINGVNEQEAVQ